MRAAAAALTVFAILASAPCAMARTWRVEPGADAQALLRGAFLQAQPGDTIRLERGRFELNAGLTLNTSDIEIRGEGEDRTILSFTGQSGREDSLLITSNGVELRDFAVENTPGAAITARDCNGVTFRGLRVQWTRGPHPENGPFGLHTINCSNVLIDGAIVRGASDAGVNVSQSRNIIVRNSQAEMNVAGFVIENSYNADVFSNTATQNTGGVLVVDLPGLAQKDGHGVRLFENTIVANNSANFARPGSLVSAVPAGTGVLIMAARDVHVFGNEIGEHRSANVIITAFRGSIEDPQFTPLPRDIMIRDNAFGLSGQRPAGELEALARAGATMPDVLWDGADTFFAGGMVRTLPVRIVMRDNEKDSGGAGSFLSLGVSVAGAPLSEGAPNPRFPPLVDLIEPARVRLDD